MKRTRPDPITLFLAKLYSKHITALGLIWIVIKKHKRTYGGSFAGCLLPWFLALLVLAVTVLLHVYFPTK